MRKAMICVSFMLALLQIWPMIFGHDTSQALAAEPISVVAPSKAAVRSAVALPVPATTTDQSRPSVPAMESCLRLYQRALNTCRAGDSACRLTVSDRWQVCEATGF